MQLIAIQHEGNTRTRKSTLVPGATLICANLPLSPLLDESNGV